jgi:hypothetical protein
MAIRYTYRIHLTPRGWKRRSSPSDALQSWEVEVARGETLEPGKARFGEGKKQGRVLRDAYRPEEVAL